MGMGVWIQVRCLLASCVLVDQQAFRMVLSRILTIAPGGEQQEISCHQACRHDHGGELLQLFNLHPCIVTLPFAESWSRSRTVKPTDQGQAVTRLRVEVQLCLLCQAEGSPHQQRDDGETVGHLELPLLLAENTAGHP